jgi:hypothetical protein
VGSTFKMLVIVLETIFPCAHITVVRRYNRKLGECSVYYIHHYKLMTVLLKLKIYNLFCFREVLQ